MTYCPHQIKKNYNCHVLLISLKPLSAIKEHLSTNRKNSNQLDATIIREYEYTKTPILFSGRNFDLPGKGVSPSHLPLPHPLPGPKVFGAKTRLGAHTQKTLRFFIHAVFSTSELADDQFTLRFSHAVFSTRELAHNQFYIIKEWGFL